MLCSVSYVLTGPERDHRLWLDSESGLTAPTAGARFTLPLGTGVVVVVSVV